MQLIGALAAGVFAFFAIGLATGKAPRVQLPTRSRKRPDAGPRQVWLRQAGVEATPAQYALGLATIAALTFALVVAATSTPVVALAPALGLAALPHAYFARRRLRNLEQVQAAWPDAIRELLASIESGASLHNAMVLLSKDGPEALRPALERFPAHAATVGTVPALEAVRERLADPTSDRVIEVLILAHERGGPVIADILRDLARTTVDDVQLREELESAGLEQKINARAVLVLPWIVLVLLTSSSPGYRAFYRTSGGVLVVVGGAALSLLGAFLVGRLARERGEPRVFGSSATSAQGGGAS